MPTRRRPLLLAAALAALGAAASPAAGAEYCLAPEACEVPVGTLQEALDAAALTPDADLVRLPPGTVGGPGFAYDAPSALEIRGAGAGATVLEGVQGADTLLLAGGPHLVGDLEVRVPANAAGGENGLTLTGGAAGEDLVVSSPGSVTGSSAVRVGQGSVLRRSSVLTAQGDTGVVAATPGTDAGSVEDTVITGTAAALGTAVAGGGSPAAPLGVRRVRIAGYGTGVSVDGGAAEVGDSLVDLGTVAGAGGIVARPVGGALSASITATRVTVVGGGLDQTGVEARASQAGRRGEVTLTGSVVRVGADSTSLACSIDAAGAEASLDARRNALSAFADVEPGCGGIRGDNLPATADPFRSAATGDYTPRAGSALLDQALTPPVPAPGATDALGRPRAVDGTGDGVATADLGAFEYQRQPPVVQSLTAAPGAPVTGQPVAFAASAGDPEGEALTYAWSFGDGAVGVGASPSRAYALPGRYLVTVTVTDAAGASAVRTLTVEVAAAPSPPPPAPPAPPPPAAAPAIAPPPTVTQGASPAPDAAPVLGPLTAPRGRLARSRGGFALAPQGVRPVIATSLSEPASIQITLARRAGGSRFLPLRGVRAVSAPAGPVRLRVPSRWAAAPLGPGTYRIRAVAVDAAGLTSRARTLVVVLR